MNDNIKAGSDIHAGDGGYSEGTQEEYEKFVKVRNQSLNKARIKEFEKQSGLEIFGLGARRDIWEATMEKFTELVVKECMEVALTQKKWVEDQEVFDARDITWNKARIQQSQRIVDKIKEHFGVEE